MQKADPRARKKAIGILFLGAAVGATAIYAFKRYEMEISSWLAANVDWIASHPGMFFVVGLILISPLLLLTGYLYLYGLRIVRTKRIPPPNYSVTRNTIVRTGNQAVLRGRIVQLLSAILMLAGSAIPIIFWYLLYRVSRVS